MKTAISDIEKEMIRKMEEDQKREEHFQTPEPSNDVLSRALKSIIANRGQLTPFALAMRCKDFGGDVKPKAAEAYLKANQYQEALPSWLPVI